MKSYYCSLLLMLVASTSMAAVEGNVVEKMGTKWQTSSFDQWIKKENALITPESSNLAVQYCLRTSQERIDALAYDKLAKKLVQDFNQSYAGKTSDNPLEKGLTALSSLLSKIDAIDVGDAFPNPRTYITRCNTVVGKEIGSSTDLLVLYDGRMHPKEAKNIPPAIAEKLKKLHEQGVRIAPLTREGLVEQICKLEGYYSTSYDPKLWKFFSLTRAMSNVLPSEEKNDEFKKLLATGNIADSIGELNRYSAVAGKPNGLSIGMSTTEIDQTMKETPVRMTGVALGTSATSLMSFFTTSWREKLQDAVLQTQYPEKPFKLLSAATVMGALDETFKDVEMRDIARKMSQTELGMSLAYSAFIKDTGDEMAHFRRTAALAWVALNAETNIRQNEKLGGLERTAILKDEPATRFLFADVNAYNRMNGEIEAALSAYKIVDTDGSITSQNCLGPTQTFVKAAMKASQGNDQKVVKLTGDETDFFSKNEFKSSFEFKPVIADIGTELKRDKEGIDGQHDFNLHLATGYWREIPVKMTFDGKPTDLILGTPSAFVLHLKDTTSTADWQQGMVQKYDTQN